MLCLPVLRQSKLLGILYLENNLAAGAFTPDRRAVLETLASQAAISLENAQTYKALQESEAKYRRIVDTANEGIWVLGPDALTVFVNARMAGMLGYTSEEMIGRPLTDFMFEEDASGQPLMMERRQQGISENFERRFRHKDGHTVWTMVSAAPIFDDQGGFRGAFGMHTDITGRKQAEQEMSLLNFAMNNVHEAAFLIDENARFRYVNDEACRKLQYAREEFLNLHIPDIDPDFPGGRWPSHWCDLKEQHSLIFEGRHKTKGGCNIPVEINANYIEYGNVGYVLALVRDITERRAAEAELHRHKEHLEDTVKQRTAELLLARDAAEAANKAKSAVPGQHEPRAAHAAELPFSASPA